MYVRCPRYSEAVRELACYVEHLIAKDNVRMYSGVAIQHGNRYSKIIKLDSNGEDSSIWCFIDHDGSILKPASYRAPAKHARGNIYDSATWKDFKWTGPQYLRGVV